MAEEDKKVDDEYKCKGAKVNRELGRVSLQLTMPPLTPVVPSTSQQANTVDSVAFMARKRVGSSTSARIDQWSLLGHDDKKGEKGKQGYGKGEDKGKLSPQHVVQLGVASSIGVLGVPPLLSPHRGGVTPGPVVAVGGANGHIKLEPQAKFTGKEFPTIWDWLEETTNWLELSPWTPD